MTTFPNFPQFLKAGLVFIDSASAAVLRIITLQYYLVTLSRSLPIKGIGAEAVDRLETLRLTGLPVETVKSDAEAAQAVYGGRRR